MLKNYIKIAIAVLKRRKFFTFISLFGISITLTILIVLTAFFDHIFSAGYPDYKRERSLYVTVVQQKNSKGYGASTGPPSFYFLNTYVKTLKTPAKVAISSTFSPTNTYINNKKLVLDIKYANADYWDVLEYKFLEGKPFTDQQIQRGEYVAVISADTKKEYFGTTEDVVGKYIETDNVKYRVIGVVKDVPITQFTLYADLIVPYTLPKSDYKSKDLNGSYMAIILANSKKDFPAIKEEFQQVVRKIPPQNKEFDLIYCQADSKLDGYTRILFGDMENSGKSIFLIVTTTLILFFMLLPTLNLVNINISRILERSSEIGVRKAFGASAGKLVIQFIVENIILTFLGGIIALLLSALAIYIINTSGAIPYINLEINFKVVLVSIVLCLLFGFISGVYPAWRMSRLQVVNALKAAV